MCGPDPREEASNRPPHGSTMLAAASLTSSDIKSLRGMHERAALEERARQQAAKAQAAARRQREEQAEQRLRRKEVEQQAHKELIGSLQAHA